MMTGETDLAMMLADLEVEQRQGTFAIVSAAHRDIEPLRNVALASIRETEGDTLVVPFITATNAGFEPEFEAAWLTLTVHSSLSAVGLTAAVSTALSDVGIACNMLAGFFHDHLLVPATSADTAIQALANLGS